MAHFYGTVQCNRGQATRSGNYSLDVSAQSYEGVIDVTMERSREGVNVFIHVRPHGGGDGTLLYGGLVRDLLDMEKRAAMMHVLGVQKFTEGCSNADV